MFDEEVGSKRTLGGKADTEVDRGSDDISGKSGSGPVSGGDIGSEGGVSGAKAEIRSIVDPVSGSFKNKVTIPKNFRGMLHLSGINLGSLNSQLLKARFRFGTSREAVPAEGLDVIVGRGQGITDFSQIDVLSVDMRNEPFKNLRLPYNLFDYTNYADENGVEKGIPESNPRSRSLYCRGLKLEDDHTFAGSSFNNACDEANEKCLYAYAKIQDSTLYYQKIFNENLELVSERPSYSHVTYGESGYSNEDNAIHAKRCLPENANDPSSFESVFGLSGLTDPPAYDSNILLGTETYVYRGPYLPIGQNSWEIAGNAIFSTIISNSDGGGPSGLFRFTIGSDASGGYQSLLFPRAGKSKLQANVEYIGSDDAFGARNFQTLAYAGQSKYMDGCNIRQESYNSETGEDISSCNVLAAIEIFENDEEGNEIIVVSTTSVKLQVIRASATDNTGTEVFESALKQCNGNNSLCGANECCFGNSCWSKNIVPRCLDRNSNEGNLSTGEVCSTDYKCASLCCNPTTKTCADHKSGTDNPIYCSKAPGQSCVSDDYCRLEPITVPGIYRLGHDDQGNLKCGVRRFVIPTHGSCVAGTCVVPETPPDPSFNEDDPNRCDNAKSLPTNLSNLVP